MFFIGILTFAWLWVFLISKITKKENFYFFATIDKFPGRRI
jgi:hypothetical protein